MSEAIVMSARRLKFFLSHHRVDPDTGCWIWTGSPNRTGYGQFSIMENGKRLGTVAHRVVFEHFKHKIPDGLVLDHLCRVRMCVNPDHLEPVTNRENILRGVGESIARHFAVECLAGHPLEGDNLYVKPSGRRSCRKCATEQRRAYYWRLVAKGKTPRGIRSERARLRTAADHAGRTE